MNRDEALCWKPKRSSEYTTEEKCAAFDFLHARAMVHLDDERAGQNFNHEDTKIRIWTSVMALLGDGWCEAFSAF